MPQTDITTFFTQVFWLTILSLIIIPTIVLLFHYQEFNQILLKKVNTQHLFILTKKPLYI